VCLRHLGDDERTPGSVRALGDVDSRRHSAEVYRLSAAATASAATSRKRSA
jgi:hypothetical protein